MITHFLRKVKAALSDFEENNRSETRKSGSFRVRSQGWRDTTLEIYCGKNQSSVAGYQRKVQRNTEGGDSVSVLRVA